MLQGEFLSDGLYGQSHRLGSRQKLLTMEFCHKSTRGIATAVGEQEGKAICVGVGENPHFFTPESVKYFFSSAEGAQEISGSSTGFSGGLGRAGGMVGLGDPGGLFSPEQFQGSAEPRRAAQPGTCSAHLNDVASRCLFAPCSCRQTFFFAEQCR